MRIIDIQSQDLFIGSGRKLIREKLSFMDKAEPGKVEYFSDIL